MVSNSSESSSVESPTTEPSWRELLGLPPPHPVLDEEPPRAVDLEQLRDFHSGDLGPVLEAEIQLLTQCYHKWADANNVVLVELLNGDFDDISSEDFNNGESSKLA